MGTFLKENWLWILAPMVLIPLTYLLVVLFSEDPGAPTFIYNI
jgi:hypothetical protein